MTGSTWSVFKLSIKKNMGMNGAGNRCVCDITKDATQPMRLQSRKTGLAHSKMQVMIKN
jgi:hypothetical protein